MMLTINTKIVPNDKFTTATIGCFLRLPLTSHNLAYASLITRLQSNASLFYPTISSQEAAMSNLYDLQFEASPQLFGKELIVSYIANFIEPQEILDPEYTYQAIVDLFAKIVQHPSFDDELIEYTKRQILADYQELIQEPANYALDRFFKLWYQDEPDYAENFVGPVKEIEEADDYSLREFFDNMKMLPVAVVGFAKGSSQVEKLIHDHFKQPGLIKRFMVDNLTIPAPKLQIDEFDEQDNYQAQLLIGYGFAGKMTYQEQIAGMMLAQYLAGDQSSKLFVKVREELGAAYAIDANNYANNSLFLINAGLDPEKADEAKAIILQEVNKVANGEIDEALFKKAKKSLKNVQLIGQDHESWHLAQLLRGELFSGYQEFNRDWAISHLTMKQMTTFAKKLFLNESYVLK